MTKRILLVVALPLMLAGCGAATSESNMQSSEQDASVQTPAATQQQAGIRLTSPQVGQVLTSPFLVGGEAQLDDPTIHIRVKNMTGDTLIEETTLLKAEAGEKGPFGVLISFAFQSTDTGIVEVYGVHPTTGAEVVMESVAVSFDTSSGGSAEVLQ